MKKSRADLGFGDELDSFNPSDWAPKPEKTANDRPKAEATREAAIAAGFRSREAVQSMVSAKPRRRRTGRNAQFNIKAKPETIEEFCAIADDQGWGIGETLEYAVELLKREYPQK
ncbi:MAG: hypothetical protein RIC52_11160 [Amphiplicatus sp.]